MRGLVLAAALLSAAGAARADDFWPTPEPPADRRAYERAMARADAFADGASRTFQHSRVRGQHYARQALEAYEEAARLEPGAAEPHYRAGAILYYHFYKGYERAADGKRLVEHWDAFEKLAPLDARLAQRPGQPSFLFERSIVRTKLGGEDNYRLALSDYEKQLALADEASMPVEWVGIVLTNSAEVLMALGRLDEAIEHYRLGLDYIDKPVYRYGLAVALDRDGQGAKALEIMAEMAAVDGLRGLSEEGVFFIPDGDEQYYAGLGYEALGDHERALGAFEQYLIIAVESRYHARAREHVAQLKKQKPGLKPVRRPAPREVSE